MRGFFMSVLSVDSDVPELRVLIVDEITQHLVVPLVYVVSVHTTLRAEQIILDIYRDVHAQSQRNGVRRTTVYSLLLFVADDINAGFINAVFISVHYNSVDVYLVDVFEDGADEIVCHGAGRFDLMENAIDRLRLKIPHVDGDEIVAAQRLQQQNISGGERLFYYTFY